MIKVQPNDLDSNLSNQLNGLQKLITEKSSFTEKTEASKMLWKTKGGSGGKELFDALKSLLLKLCIHEGRCIYCEDNEPSDIEHIYPKSYFPELTFDWQNYILACKLCNSGYKLDKCFTINDSSEVENTSRGNEPNSREIAFINPRTDNPDEFMVLNPKTFKYEIVRNLNLRSEIKAKYTIIILGLNQRDVLIAGRRSAAEMYFNKLEKLTRILYATNIDEIKKILSPYEDRLDKNKDYIQIKLELKEGFKKFIQTYKHPSVWYSIKLIESKYNDKWKNLFDKLPEALEW